MNEMAGVESLDTGRGDGARYRVREVATRALLRQWLALAILLLAALTVGAGPQDFAGSWINVDPHTNGITRIDIEQLPSGALEARVFGKCHPSDCDWGSEPLITYGSSITDSDHTAATVSYDFGWSRQILTLQLERELPVERIQLMAFAQFTDRSGRQNTHHAYALERSRPDRRELPDAVRAQAAYLSSGFAHTCGLRADGSAVCWGGEFGADEGPAHPPPGERFVSISSGYVHSCGLRADGAAVCWGAAAQDYGQAAPPRGERLVSLSSGYTHTCGLRADGSAVCWGAEDGADLGQAAPPRGEQFVSISSGYVHTCGLRADGGAVCWGAHEDDYGQVDVPSGERFRSISAGGGHTCALREDGSAVCWGARDDADEGQADPPPGERFVSLSSGLAHTCGLRADGGAVCWGAHGEDHGQADAPSGERFVWISAGGVHTCALRADGSAACWGADEDGTSGGGPSTPPAGVVFAVDGVDPDAPRRPQPRTPGDDHSNVPSRATELTTSVTGHIETGADIDYFRFEIASRSQVTIHTTGELDTVGVLEHAAAGGLEPIASNDDGGSGYNFEIARTLEAGRYYVKVESYESETGGYTVHLDAVSVRPAVEPDKTARAMMYWTDEDTGTIRRANLDGTGVEDVVAGLSDPDGLALDVAGGKMYWTDDEADKIQRANLDGTAIEDVVNGLSSPEGIALDLSRGNVYWTDRGTDKIQRAKLDGTGVEDVVTGLSDPDGIALDVAGGKMYWTESDAGRIRRANLDGTDREDLVTGLSYLDDIALDATGGKMYWAHVGADKIQRANLDGTGVEDLVTGLDRPVGVTVDVRGGKVYWADVDTEMIQRANLDGTAVEDLVTTGLFHPDGIALFLPGQAQRSRRVAVINPDLNRILKAGYLYDPQGGPSFYFSVAHGEVADRCDIEDPACWSGVGRQMDFIGQLLDAQGYDVTYYAADSMPPITVDDFDLVVVQDPLATNHRRFERTQMDGTVPDLLDHVRSPQFRGRIVEYHRSGGSLILVGDAVRLLELDPGGAGEPGAAQVVGQQSVATTVSQPDSRLPEQWLFVRGGPFCGGDRVGAATYTIAASRLGLDGAVIAQVRLLNGNDLPHAAVWSDTVYAPAEATSLLDLHVAGAGGYVLRGDTCTPPEYQVAVDATVASFMGHTLWQGRNVFYIGSDSLFDFRFRSHSGAWHAGEFYEIDHRVTDAGRSVILALVERALAESAPRAASRRG